MACSSISTTEEERSRPQSPVVECPDDVARFGIAPPTTAEQRLLSKIMRDMCYVAGRLLQTAAKILNKALQLSCIPQGDHLTLNSLTFCWLLLSLKVFKKIIAYLLLAGLRLNSAHTPISRKREQPYSPLSILLFEYEAAGSDLCESPKYKPKFHKPQPTKLLYFDYRL